MKQNFILIILILLWKCNNTISDEFLNEKINETELIQNHDKWKITYNTTDTTVSYIDMYEELKIFVEIDLYNEKFLNSNIKFYCENNYICDCSDKIFNIENKKWEGFITVKGLFIGRTKLYTEIQLPNNSIEKGFDYLNVIVLKKFDFLDKIFTISLGIMVSIIFVSFGAVLEIKTLKEILLKPIGPTIGFCCQYILMPTLSYFIGYLLFSNDTNLWLGLFFSGVSPGGGASNMWTLLLKGNVNLSIVMTTISNLAAFVMMPLWIFTLGKLIFDRGDLGVPYERIATLSVSLLIPLIIGLAIQKFLPKLARILIRLLKPISVFILIFIITFAIVTNLYMFKLFSWKILVAGMVLPWCGYTLSYILAWLLRQNKPDCLTISIETGLQNTGIAIFLLRFSLDQPEADLTSIVPVAVSIMTKLPLLLMYLIQRFCCTSREINEATSPQTKEIEPIMPRPK